MSLRLGQRFLAFGADLQVGAKFLRRAVIEQAVKVFQSLVAECFAGCHNPRRAYAATLTITPGLRSGAHCRGPSARAAVFAARTASAS